MEPSFAITHLILGRVYIAKNKLFEAIDELKKARELSGNAVMMAASLGVAYARAGKLEEAKGILEELKARSQKQYVSSYWMAGLYGAMGDMDKLYELWNKAYEERNEGLIGIKIYARTVQFHSDPRYKALLKKMGLE